MILQLLRTATSRQLLRCSQVQTTTTFWRIQTQQFASEGKRGRRKFVEAAVVKSTKSTKQTVDVWKQMNPS